MPSISTTIVAPTGGLNTRDPLELMPETDAITLENLFPETTYVRLRKGFTLDYSTSSSTPVQSVMEYVGDTGSRRLLAAFNGGISYTTGSDLISLSAAGTYTSNKWQHVNFNGVLIMCNGVDQPKQFNGSALSDATYTGVSDDASLVHVSVYKSRLYFIQSGSQSIWYGDTNDITGALTELDVGGILRLGGTVMYAGSLTRDTGAGMNDLFIIVSEMGEVLVYTGSDPGDAAWTLVGRYYIAPPVAVRGFENYENDLVILTQEGLVSVQRLLSQGATAVKLTEKIQDQFATAYRDYGSNYGWQVKWFPKGHMLIVNVPTQESLASEQFVMNTLTGAWCKFTGMDTSVWGLFNNSIMFGGVSGNIYQAENGYSDNEQDISWEMRSAFNYFGNRAQQKHFKQVRPLLISDSAVTYSLGVDVDFGDVTPTATANAGSNTGTSWDSGDWDTSSWDSGSVNYQWWGLQSVGRCAAIRMEGSSNSIAFTIAAANIIYEQGGMF